MKQHKFTDKEIEKIAHELAVNAAILRGTSQYEFAVKSYTEAYNGTVKEFEKYNNSIKD